MFSPGADDIIFNVQLGVALYRNAAVPVALVGRHRSICDEPMQAQAPPVLTILSLKSIICTLSYSDFYNK